MKEKLRLTKKNRSGFTLVETVVAFALAAILFAALISVIAPAYRMYARSRAYADAQLIAGNVLDTIRTSAMNTSELTADGDTVHIGRRNAFTAPDGQLLYNDEPVYDEKYYDGKQITLSAEQAGENIILATVTVTQGDIPPVRVTAVISPIRRILGEEGDAEAQTLLDRARQAAQGGSNSPQDSFDGMYIGGDGTNTGFDPYAANKIISTNRLNELRAEAAASGTAEEVAFFDELLSKNFYLAVYFPQAANQPVVYLTDVQSASSNTGNPMYFVYYDGNWYMRNPNRLSADSMSAFDGMTHASIINFLNQGREFILAGNVKLPLP